MVIGLGIDICENDRIAGLVARYGERFLNRIYQPAELEYCMSKKDPIPHLTARFALKEAFIKALSLPRSLALSYKEVGLVGLSGKKTLVANGHLQFLYEQKGGRNVHFSISHASTYSNAIVIIEDSDRSAGFFHG